MLYAAAIVSFALGVGMLPVSFLGTIVAHGIGLFGLSPFVAAWVYLRNGARHHVRETRRLWSRAAAGGMFLFFATTAIAQLFVTGALHWSVAHADTRGSAIVARTITPLVDAEKLVQQYLRGNEVEQRKLAIVYQRMTGRPIDERVAWFVAD